MCWNLLALACLLAQGPTGPTFEVASVKPAGPYTPGRPVGARGGPGTDDPARIHWSYVPMQSLLRRAFGVKAYQIEAPAWTTKEFYDIDAKVPLGTTGEQLQLMVRNLLVERFHLNARVETRVVQVYELVTARNGHRLKLSPPAAPNTKPIPDDPIGPNGQPLGRRAPDGIVELPSAARGKGHIAVRSFLGSELRVRREGLEYLLQRLEDELQRPIIDKTGITGLFDYTLAYVPPGRVPPSPGADGMPVGPEVERPDLFTALQLQLGLKLESKKAPCEVLIVLSVDKVPTEN
jgi:uncharacterized protein (TIGR03435 family)